MSKLGVSKQSKGVYYDGEFQGGIMKVFNFKRKRRLGLLGATLFACATLLTSCLLDDSASASSSEHLHEYTAETVAATCTEAGYTKYVCSCGEFYIDTESYTDALGHSYDYNNINWQWKTGYGCDATVTCSRESCTETTEGHTYTYEATVTTTVLQQPTCDAAGSQEHSAQITVGEYVYFCSEKVTETLAATGNHTLVDDGNGVAATCTSTGWTSSKTCSVCNKVIVQREEIPMLDHTPVSDNNGTEATCTATGLTASYHCSVCGTLTQEQEVIPMVDHTPVDDGNRVESTCTEAGLSSSTSCSVCHTVLSAQQALPLKAHTLVGNNDAVEPTCISIGYTESQSCSVCKQLIVPREEIAMIDHVAVSDENGIEPTCTSYGYTASTHCANCSKHLSDREQIPMSDHTLVKDDNAVEPTCKSVGYTASYSCSVCHQVITDRTEIAKLSHTFGSNGLELTCSRGCGEYNPLYTALSTRSDVEKIANDLDGYYYLANDIDMSGSWWTPISNFAGVLDGNDHSLTNFSYNLSNDNSRVHSTGGLFAENYGTVRNLSVDSFSVVVSFDLDKSNTWENWTDADNITADYGSIAVTNYGIIDSCKLTGNLTMKNSRADRRYFTWAASAQSSVLNDATTVNFGGFVANNRGTISNCTNAANSTFSTYGYIQSKMGAIGGVAGSDFWNLNLRGNFGGICAVNNKTVSNCSLTHSMSFSSEIITNRIKNVGTSGWPLSTTSTGTVGTIVGYNLGSLTGASTVELSFNTSESRQGYTTDSYTSTSISYDGDYGAYGKNEGGTVGSITRL